MPYLKCPMDGCTSRITHISVMPGWYETTGKRMKENPDGSFAFPCISCFKKMTEAEKELWDFSENSSEDAK